jgi:hypothetical protein
VHDPEFSKFISNIVLVNDFDNKKIPFVYYAGIA